ncbi:hypothetical protein B0H11DRAFT_199425 [Mycena galericulata]|nr:hypothetical protein B0H11DRAFT_199425 [Mycena galericulata]
MSTFTVPTGFSYVVAALTATPILLTWQTFVVRRNRKLSGIEYPRLYADKAEMDASPAAVKFNCAQRAHQNTLEHIAQVYMMTIVLGLKYPVVAASALGLWVVGRIAYTRGYATGIPAKRNNIIARLSNGPSMLTLLVGSIYSAYQLVSEGI